MATDSLNSKGFLIGATIGGLTALLIAPKAGRKLREDLHDVYCDLSEKTHSMASNIGKTGKSIAKNFGYQTGDWTDKAREMIDDVSCWVQSNGNHHARDLIIGGVAGGVIGTVAGLLLAPKSGSELRQDLADVSEDFAGQMSKTSQNVAKHARSQANDWLDLAKQIVNNLTETIEDVGENAAAKGKEFSQASHSRLNEVMELASLGFRLWQNMKKKRS